MQSALGAPRLATPAVSSIRHLPVNLFASVMGLSGLALAWRLGGKMFGASVAVASGIGMLALAVFGVLALAYLLKSVRHPDAVRAEFLHPVSGNFFGTINIGILLLSSILGTWSGRLQQLTWTVGAIATVLLGAVILYRLLSGNTPPASAVPAWLIPGVASLDIVVAGATLPLPWAPELNLFAGSIGGVLAVVLFVMIMSRLIHGDPLPAAMTPSLMILIAPFEVGFLAYVNFTHGVDGFAALLFYFGLFLFVVLALRIFRPSIPFGASWWAISFPLAALANAALVYAAATGSAVLTGLAALLLAFLTIVIGVLAVRTLHALFAGKLLTK